MHKVRESNRKDLLSTQAQVIAENVEDKFVDYFNHIAYSAVQLGKVRDNLLTNKPDLQILYDDFLKQNPSVLGINKINNKGILDEVYPHQDNKNALNKKTQAHDELFRMDEDQHIWLSAPFHLYQGMSGFAFYVRTQPKKKEWLAIVITSEAFFEKFIYDELRENFHVHFKESISQSVYLRTADISSIIPLSTIQERTFSFYNRDFKIII